MEYTAQATRETPFTALIQSDPELLYVECEKCGRPVVWERGRSTALVVFSGLEFEELDDTCMIYSIGCSACTPGQERFDTKIVRLFRPIDAHPGLFHLDPGKA